MSLWNRGNMTHFSFLTFPNTLKWMCVQNSCCDSFTPAAELCLSYLAIFAIVFCPPPHCCVSLHENSTTSCGQMFYCSAQQLLQWLASIQMNLLQLAATSEPGQSFATRRKAVVNVNDGGNMLPCWYFPWEDKILQIEGSGELGFKGCWLSCNKDGFLTSESQMFPQLQATEEARKTWQMVENKRESDFLWHVSWSPCPFSWSKAAAYSNSWPPLHNHTKSEA